MKRRDFIMGLTGTTVGATTVADAKPNLRYAQAQSKKNKVPLGTALRNSFAEQTVQPKKFPTTWLKNDPSKAHPDALSFSFNQGAGKNPTERDNVVHRWGINIRNNGLQEVKSEPSLAIEFEELWETGKRRLAEYHHNLIDTDGKSRRLLTSSWNRGDIARTLDLAFTSSVVSFSEADKENTTRLKFDWAKDKIYVGAGTNFQFDQNDRPLLVQKGGKDTGYIEAIRINQKNEVELGRNGAGISMGGSLRLGGGQNYILPKSTSETIEIGNNDSPVNSVVINSSSPEALKLKDPSGGRYTFMCHRSSFMVRDDAHQSKQIIRLDSNGVENSLRIRSSGGVGFGTKNPEAGVHIAKTANGGGLAMEARNKPRTPSEGTGVIFVDQDSGDLNFKIRYDGKVKTIKLADFQKS
ncbi:MAG: hypothetical protein GKS01_10370 [Alphaproteobacteria bacterium]|nr:hypothetical protein [Alphaproteobacteria bacterium]